MESCFSYIICAAPGDKGKGVWACMDMDGGCWAHVRCLMYLTQDRQRECVFHYPLKECGGTLADWMPRWWQMVSHLTGWLAGCCFRVLRGNWLYGWFVWLALDSPPSASKRTKPQSTQTHPTLGSVCTLAPQSVDINERPREYVFTLRLYHKHFCQNQKHLMK